MSKSQIIIGILIVLAIGVVALFKLNGEPARSTTQPASNSYNIRIP